MMHTAASSSPPAAAATPAADVLERRLRAALWCALAGDALAAPTHWYYGGLPQIQRDYGRAGIVDYTKPVYHLPGSILNKSNLNGGGRDPGRKSGKSRQTIVGDVILHGKQDLWHPAQQIHYHATLHAGETTLEATLGRVLMRSVTATGGVLDAAHFRAAYMEFMRTPGSHNDTYASTCHRMFFANLIFRNKAPEDCPDNDHHNVDVSVCLLLIYWTSESLVCMFGGAMTGEKHCGGCSHDADANVSHCPGLVRFPFLRPLTGWSCRRLPPWQRPREAAVIRMWTWDVRQRRVRP